MCLKLLFLLAIVVLIRYEAHDILVGGWHIQIEAIATFLIIVGALVHHQIEDYCAH